MYTLYAKSNKTGLYVFIQRGMLIHLMDRMTLYNDAQIRKRSAVILEHKAS